jgi:hypothetical protein
MFDPVSKRTILIAGTVAAVLLVAAVSFWFTRKRVARLTAKAPASVTSVSLDRGSRKKRFDTDTRVSYRYVVGGRTLDGAFTKNGDQRSTFKAGMSAKACYNPSKPEESEVFKPDHRCGR